MGISRATVSHTEILKETDDWNTVFRHGSRHQLKGTFQMK